MRFIITSTWFLRIIITSLLIGSILNNEPPKKILHADISTKGITTTVAWNKSNLCQKLNGYRFQVNYTDGQRWYIGCNNTTKCSCIMSRHIIITSIEIVITATNKFGSTSSDGFIYYMANNVVPYPPNAVMVNAEYRSITVRWRAPLGYTSMLLYEFIVYKRRIKPLVLMEKEYKNVVISADNLETSFKHTFFDLIPGATYEFYIVSKTRYQEVSEPTSRVRISLPEEKPYAGPTDLKCTCSEPDPMGRLCFCHWKSIDPWLAYGVIVEYDLYYIVASEDLENRTANKISAMGNITTVELRNLSSEVSYTVTVVGRNKAGSSVSSKPFTIQRIPNTKKDFSGTPPTTILIIILVVSVLVVSAILILAVAFFYRAITYRLTSKANEDDRDSLMKETDSVQSLAESHIYEQISFRGSTSIIHVNQAEVNKQEEDGMQDNRLSMSTIDSCPYSSVIIASGYHESDDC
ncbi:Interleukin-12 receptor subunit beta-2 [Trichoplax sp. H2]|nr:Interleukin-12 receptor subunit beta-2 [Trichoplax sp. H2]|eukprot:RDD46155.1 Interleukin-12 receptor subunit beta-2 [Trichoplax sp. H2]